MDKPTISIIVPVYKVEKYLDRCVSSILNQTFTDFELILVDDGSPDNCPKMCNEWANKDARIKVIHKKNGGLSSARNAGLDIALGAYIGFVDSDDWIAPDMYQILFDLIHDDLTDISVCSFEQTSSYHFLPTSSKKTVIRRWTKNEFLKRILKVHTQDSNQYAWNKLYRAEIFKNVRYPENLIDEDVEGTFAAVLNANCIIETNQIGYYYFKNKNSITNQKFSANKFDFLEICEHIHQLAIKAGDAEIIHYAAQFQYRADLAVLIRMILSEEELSQYDNIKKSLLSRVQKNWNNLLLCPMPLSRKLLVLLLKFNPFFTQICLKKLFYIKKVIHYDT